LEDFLDKEAGATKLYFADIHSCAVSWTVSFNRSLPPCPIVGRQGRESRVRLEKGCTRVGSSFHRRTRARLNTFFIKTLQLITQRWVYGKIDFMAVSQGGKVGGLWQWQWQL